ARLRRCVRRSPCWSLQTSSREDDYGGSMMSLSIGGTLAYQFQNRFFYFARGEARGVQIFSVGGLRQRGFGAGAVTMVALGDFLRDLFDGSARLGGSPHGA